MSPVDGRGFGFAASFPAADAALVLAFAFDAPTFTAVGIEHPTPVVTTIAIIAVDSESLDGLWAAGIWLRSVPPKRVFNEAKWVKA